MYQRETISRVRSWVFIRYNLVENDKVISIKISPYVYDLVAVLQGWSCNPGYYSKSDIMSK